MGEPVGAEPSLTIDDVVRILDSKSTGMALVAMVCGAQQVERPNGRWVMNRIAMAACRKLKDSEGDYLWQPPINAAKDDSPTLMGFPIVEDQSMPNVGLDGFLVAFGPSVTTPAKGEDSTVLEELKLLRQQLETGEPDGGSLRIHSATGYDQQAQANVRAIVGDAERLIESLKEERDQLRSVINHASPKLLDYAEEINELKAQVEKLTALLSDAAAHVLPADTYLLDRITDALAETGA